MRRKIVLIVSLSFLLSIAVLCIAIGKEKVSKSSAESSITKSSTINTPLKSGSPINPTNLIVGTITKLPVDTGDEPSFSPDGSKIVFVKDHYDETGLWVVNTDGTDEHCIFEGKDVFVSSPCWSPDGEKILFLKGEKYTRVDIWVMNKDGTNLTQLTYLNGLIERPVWSPDSDRILYEYIRLEKSGIYSVNSNGTDTIRLTERVFKGNATYSPDGRKIAVVALTDTNRDGKLETTIGKDTYQLWVMDADGKNRKQLSDLPTEFSDEDIPLWFPDSKHILLSYDDRIINIETGISTTLEGLNLPELDEYEGVKLPELKGCGLRAVSAISKDGLILAGGNLDYPGQSNPYLYVITLKEKK